MNTAPQTSRCRLRGRTATRLLAVLSACALAALSTASAAAAAPGPQKQLARQMSLRVADLPPGARQTDHFFADDYIPLRSFITDFNRRFALAAGAARPTGLLRLATDSALFTRRSSAAGFFNGAVAGWLQGGRARRKQARVYARFLDVRHPRVLRVNGPNLLKLPNGPGFAVALTVTLASKQGPARMVIALVTVGRVVTELDSLGQGPHRARLLGLTSRLVQTARDRVVSTLAPRPLTLPTISGAPQVGGTLQSTRASWRAITKPTDELIQWQRCDPTGKTCTDIAGATGQSYNPSTADVGSVLRVADTGSNGVAQRTVVSAPTTVVVQPPPPMR